MNSTVCFLLFAIYACIYLYMCNTCMCIYPGAHNDIIMCSWFTMNWVLALWNILFFFKFRKSIWPQKCFDAYTVLSCYACSRGYLITVFLANVIMCEDRVLHISPFGICGKACLGLKYWCIHVSAAALPLSIACLHSFYIVCIFTVVNFIALDKKLF